jgi:hypothetical protein
MAAHLGFETIQVKPYVAGGGGELDWIGCREILAGIESIGTREVLTAADGRRYEECGWDIWGAVGG